MINDNIPVYKAKINPNGWADAMYAVSLVEFPAVEKDFQIFSNQKKQLKFAVENEEKRIVKGLLMSCDTPIYRISDYGEEYYIMFDAETIKIMARKFLREGFNNNVDLEHSFEYIPGVELLEIFIKDTARGINPTGFEDVNDGSLFGSFYVSSEDVWQEIKKGTYKGFSIEVSCDIEPVITREEQEISEIEDLIMKINDKIKKNK